MRGIILGLCACTPFALGATSVTVDDADLVLVSGPGPVEVESGSVIYRNASENGSPWQALLTRDAGQSSIQFQASAEGSYDMQVWSVPSDQSNPQRQKRTETAIVGPDPSPGGPYTTPDLLNLLATWGECSGCEFDLNGDGVINVTDLLILLDDWDHADD